MFKLLKKLLKMLLAPFKMLYKMMSSPMGAMFLIMLFAIVMVIVVAMKQGGQENFSKLKRYFYMYSPTAKNSSHDIRGDNLAIKKDQEDVGIFYESSLEKNQANQRLYSDFAEMNDNVESPMNTGNNVVKE